VEPNRQLNKNLMESADCGPTLVPCPDITPRHFLLRPQPRPGAGAVFFGIQRVGEGVGAVSAHTQTARQLASMSRSARYQPGAMTPTNRGLLGSTTGLCARSPGYSVSKAMLCLTVGLPPRYAFRGGRSRFQYLNCGIAFNWSLVAL
jgi:hypothetical protein